MGSLPSVEPAWDALSPVPSARLPARASSLDRQVDRWMDSKYLKENMTLSEINQSQKDTLYDSTYVSPIYRGPQT